MRPRSYLALVLLAIALQKSQVDFSYGLIAWLQKRLQRYHRFHVFATDKRQLSLLIKLTSTAVRQSGAPASGPGDHIAVSGRRRVARVRVYTAAHDARTARLPPTHVRADRQAESAHETLDRARPPRSLDARSRTRTRIAKGNCTLACSSRCASWWAARACTACRTACRCSRCPQCTRRSNAYAIDSPRTSWSAVCMSTCIVFVT